MNAVATKILLASCLAIIVYSQCEAEDVGYWSLDLPVPENASNSEQDTNLDFLIKSVSFDWQGRDTIEIRDFYSEYFESIGWEDPMANSPGFSELKAGGWSSYNMRFNEANRPIAVYGSMWKAKDYPALGSVMVTLNGLEDGELAGSVIVQIAPEVDTSALFRLTGLIGNDPKNLFKLHNAVQGNPFELHTIALPANYEDESDPLLAEYYEIVDEIRATYKQWQSDYISQ
mgnify:CR=1 FL=1|tara:strand:+ start:384 stop:1073 length:690 start_codon:yes stop_codon:yes gene_type:complete